MKKILLFILVLGCFLINVQASESKTITLEQIAEKLNASDYGKFFTDEEMVLPDSAVIEINATVLPDNILYVTAGIYHINEEQKDVLVIEEVNLKLENNVLDIGINYLIDGVHFKQITDDP